MPQIKLWDTAPGSAFRKLVNSVSPNYSGAEALRPPSIVTTRIQDSKKTRKKEVLLPVCRRKVPQQRTFPAQC